MKSPFRFVLSAGAFALLAGCARHTPASYRYANRILTPPGIESTVTLRTVKMKIPAKCSSSEDGLTLERTGRSIKVTAKLPQLTAHPPGWLSAWALQLENKACIPAGQGSILAERVAGMLPIDPATANRLLHAHVDLGAGNKLKVTGPLLKDGAKSALDDTPQIRGNDKSVTLELRASSALLGYETAWYTLQPNPAGTGHRIVFTSGEDHVGDKITHPTTPQIDFLHFPSNAAVYRLFYMTRLSRADHDINILGAASLKEMEEQTERLEADPDLCGKIGPMCVMVPREVAVNPHIVVIAQGSEVDVSLGGAVRDALKAAGVAAPDKVLSNLRVKRRFEGKLIPVEFDATKPDILMLPLSGREELTW